jgi:hypothetical protein
MSITTCPIIPGMRDPEDQARTPSSIPAPNTIGIIPGRAQAFVRCKAIKKKNEEIRIATGAP